MIVRTVDMDRVQARSRRAVNVDTTGLALSGRLRLLRQQRGWSQQMLADFAGLSCQAVKSIEWERTDPRSSTLEALADALGVTMHALWKGETA